MRPPFLFRSGILLALAVVALALGGACSVEDTSGSFLYRSSTDSVRVAYVPGPPAAVYDSAVVVLALKPLQTMNTDSLALELMPARGGWCLPLDSFLVRDSSGWYRA